MTETIAREWIDAINARDLDRLRATLSERFVWELGTARTEGAEQSVEAWRLWFAGFPDFEFRLERMIVQGGMAASQLRMVGTHTGDFQFRGVGSMEAPLPPTQRRFDLPGCAVHEVSRGRIVHLWAYWDTATMMRQLGLVPGAPGS